KPADARPMAARRGEVDDEAAEEVLAVTGSAERGSGMGPSADYRGGGGGRLKAAKRAPRKEGALAEPRPAAAPPPPPPADPRVSAGDQKMREVAQSLMRSDKDIVIEGYADPNRGGDAMRRANDRANIVRNQLIDQGVPPARIKVLPKVEAGHNESVRLVAQ